MKHLSKVLAFLLGAILIVGCGNLRWFCKKPSTDEPTTVTYGSGMVAVYNMGITNHQLDSICLADALSQDFNDWLSTFFIDYETRDTVYKHTFIKTMSEGVEEIYVVTEWRDSLAIMKRVKQ